MKFLTSFEPVSIKMAKKQELVLNTGKLSGVCGRLMCCLGFEYSELSQENTALTEANSISISEDEEAFGMIVAASDSPPEVNEPLAQPETGSPSPAPQSAKQEYQGKHRRRRRRRGRFHGN
jgi:hypothetical protein